MIKDTSRSIRPFDGRISEVEKFVHPLKGKDNTKLLITGDKRENPVRANPLPGTGDQADAARADSGKETPPIPPEEAIAADAAEAPEDAADAAAVPDEAGEAAEAPVDAAEGDAPVEDPADGEEAPEDPADGEEAPEDPADGEEAPEDPADGEEAPEDPADGAALAPADPTLIILPGFTFLLGGGGQYIHETQIVETLVAPETVVVAPADDNRIQEVATLPEVRAGATYSLSAMELGQETGHVVIEVNELYLDTKVEKWSNDQATVTLPLVGMAKPQRAALLMLNSKGQVVESMDVTFLPAKEDSK